MSRFLLKDVKRICRATPRAYVGQQITNFQHREYVGCNRPTGANWAYTVYAVYDMEEARLRLVCVRFGEILGE